MFERFIKKLRVEKYQNTIFWPFKTFLAKFFQKTPKFFFSVFAFSTEIISQAKSGKKIILCEVVPIFYIFLVLNNKNNICWFWSKLWGSKNRNSYQKKYNFFMLFKSHLWGIHMYRPYTKPVQIITNCLEIQKNMFSITFKCLETISSTNRTLRIQITILIWEFWATNKNFKKFIDYP